MHPFGGTPICPRCNKAVYLAEQIMGPGRKLYHKPCLTCASCGKRLDSFSLVEHDQEPYCKTCHVKTFGTRDLRHANLPDRDDVFISPPTSPTRTSTTLPPLPHRASPSPVRSISNTGTPSGPPLPVRRTQTGGGIFDRSKSAVSPPPFLRPNRALSPIRDPAGDPTRAVFNPETPRAQEEHEGDTEDEEEQVKQQLTQEPPDSPVKFTPAHTHTGRSVGGFPRTIPLTPAMTLSTPTRPSTSNTPNTINGDVFTDNTSPLVKSSPLTISKSTSSISSVGTNGSSSGVGRIAVPLVPNSTGIRYGAALGGLRGTPTGGRTWGGGTPTCGKCGKTVYFAEQVKAIGKTFHKGCLRCTECNILLDSSRLTEKEGSPHCHRCYGKLYGPQGSGYALLGKAGG